MTNEVSRSLILAALGALVLWPSSPAHAASACVAGSCCETYDSFTEDRNVEVTDLGGMPARCVEAASDAVIPDDAKPCRNPQYWPYSAVSTRYPLVVHYRRPDERAMALTVVKYADTAWKFEMETLGFSAPLPDEGHCGQDGRFDIFLWRGRQSCWVDEIAGTPATAWGGRMSYMAVDPWGRNGREILRTTIGHELHHASQATDNWDVAQSVMEMSATYVEQYFGDALLYNVRDFQGRPEHAVMWLDLDDRSAMTSYHMYGAGLYFYFLRDRYFPDDAMFLSRFWKDARNRAHPAKNPDTASDAIDRLLAPVGSSFAQSMQEFARWRYYAGSRDDGRHFRTWPVPFDQLPFLSESDLKLDGTVAVTGTAADYAVKQKPMLLGSAYVEVTGQPGAASFALSLAAQAPARNPVVGAGGARRFGRQRRRRGRACHRHGPRGPGARQRCAPPHARLHPAAGERALRPAGAGRSCRLPVQRHAPAGDQADAVRTAVGRGLSPCPPASAARPW